MYLGLKRKLWSFIHCWWDFEFATLVWLDMTAWWMTTQLLADTAFVMSENLWVSLVWICWGFFSVGVCVGIARSMWHSRDDLSLCSKQCAICGQWCWPLRYISIWAQRLLAILPCSYGSSVYKWSVSKTCVCLTNIYFIILLVDVQFWLKS